MAGMIIGFSLVLVAIILWLWIERWHILLPGTWPALKWLGLKRVITLGWHGILYGRWTVPYISAVRKIMAVSTKGNRGIDLMNRYVADRYHAKVLTPDLAESIIKIDRDIPLQDLGDKVIPYSRARDIVLNASGDLALFQCGCKTSHADPCRTMDPPYNSCILIGKTLVDFLVPHNPDTSRMISREEALELLKEFHQLGLVHNAWFKDAIKDQFYVICNCCSCCCLGFQAMKWGVRQITSSGYVAVVDINACQGCETILECCPIGAIYMEAGKSQVDHDKCIGCGICVSRCPNNARLLKLDSSKGLPLDIKNVS